jgi:uncharacterized damage-inducible protein DinB
LGCGKTLGNHVTDFITKSELISKLKDSNRGVTTWFKDIPADTFFTRHGEVWSASDNVDHLIKSHKPITKALKLPKFTFQAMFGKPEKHSVTYEELCETYRDAIANGGQAFGRYLPNQQSPADTEKAKSNLLEQFSNASAELVAVTEKWNEKELDEYLLPHPLIGKLTVREMLFFTIYHNLRHASQEGD